VAFYFAYSKVGILSLISGNFPLFPKHSKSSSNSSILDKMQKLSQKGESKVIEILTENSKKSKGVDAKMKIQEFFDNKDRVKGLDSWHDQMQLNNKEKETETIVIVLGKVLENVITKLFR